ncbi:MAG: alpha-amylase family glycosyl hydrolase [Gammaproteobacteria bacterium]|nr:alpha-amylase family glycosyl hydrolase [Gammaproteobacteria bacterium]
MEKFADALSVIYRDESAYIAEKIGIHLDKVISQTLGNADKEWYRSVEIYCVYPDGVVYDKSLNPLQNLTLHLKRVQALGFNAIHVLPFLESPLLDRGFDISNYLKIQSSLGNLEDMQSFLKEANSFNIHVFMDLVFNHVSSQHEWFQKAIKGDKHYRDFFIHTDVEPKFIKKYHKDSAVWAEYEVDGEIKVVNIAFPEHTGPIPHWREGGDGYWYYHTYYPDQIDLNWLNPEVFIELAKVVIYWAKFGFNFRLDAIPFIGKGPYKEISTKNTEAQAITAALKCVADAVNLNCAFLVETYEEIESVIGYFGKPDCVSANLSYNFHLCTSIWVTLVTKDSEHIWNKLDKLYDIPDHAEWLNFLRNHDELSLAYLPDDTLKTVQDALEKHGASFREGLGISGRTFSLLAGNKGKFLMAYFLLASLPGGLMLPYGDEIATANIALTDLNKTEQKDTRNINRGCIDAKLYDLPENAAIFQLMSTLITQRKVLRLYLNNWPKRLEAPKEIFALTYTNGSDQLFIYINLNQKPVTLALSQPNLKTIMQINTVDLKADSITLDSYAGIWLKSTS